MEKETEIRIAPAFLQDETHIREKLIRELHWPRDKPFHFEILKRSVDARKREPVFVLRVKADDKPPALVPFEPKLNNVSNAPEVLIAGFGPAGMFAAIRAIELGLKPVILERGKDVRARRRDLALLNREGIVNPESNYCFGEGGAGTFSDGKLYTRSDKRGDLRRALQLFEYMGAPHDIRVDAHPHIGTNKLPQIVQRFREVVGDCGGEVRFNSRVEDVVMKDGRFAGLKLHDGTQVEGKAWIVATGHSSRGIFEMFRRNGLLVEAKPFALGVRAEHPQALIDSIQWHCEVRPDNLPAASYALVMQSGGEGVYSFCMCPGGIICPAATDDDELVVNGWSPSKRNSPFANSGIVTGIGGEELASYAGEGEFAGLRFQMETERKAYVAGGGKQVAPAVRLTDFLRNRVSSDLPACSYVPGLHPADLREVFPQSVIRRLQEGFREFGKKMKGYVTEEAVLVATESRTSSPIRIPRDRESLMHPQCGGIFPCGEGAGYAGGIMSAAMDGERCMDAVSRYLAG